ncbi:MAG: hypothetical protein IJ438_01230 [Clostridia bacterium]|nr:hypothetical protein [Clostridia bacterium]
MTCDMRLGRVLGLPAILGEHQIGHVERAVLSRNGHHLMGLMIRRGLGSAKWVDHRAIGVLGDVSVILSDKPCRPPKDCDFTLHTVKDESGLTLGWVTDAWISPETLDVTALEISLGYLEDLRRGRLIVRDWAVQPGDHEGAQVLIPREEWEVKA